MKYQLKEWSFGSNDSPYTAPECRSFVLGGKVFGHPKHQDGKNIITSTIVGKRNGCVVTRSGSEYELLEPASDYEQQYPNAKERLFKQLEPV